MVKHRKYYWICKAAKSTFPFIFDLADNEAKIEKLAVGLNGLETSPTFINEFFDFKKVRYFTNQTVSNEISVYLFYTSDQNWELLTGTVALNKDSFEKEPQLNYYLSHQEDINNINLKKIFSTIDYVWDRTFEISEEEYEEYWERWSKEVSSQE